MIPYTLCEPEALLLDLVWAVAVLTRGGLVLLLVTNKLRLFRRSVRDLKQCMPLKVRRCCVF
jgi:hypothetical protein